MMMCSDCGGIIVFQGCNSMQKIFENIGNVGTGMQIFMIFIFLKPQYKIVICRDAATLRPKTALIFNEL